MQGVDKLAIVNFTLEFPNQKLSQNARLHHMAKAALAKKARTHAHNIALLAGAGKIDKNRIQIKVVFHPATKRKRDDDNVIGAFKSYRDGIADAIGIDDSDIEFDYSLSKHTVKGGMTLVEIRTNCNTCIKCGQTVNKL